MGHGEKAREATRNELEPPLTMKTDNESRLSFDAGHHFKMCEAPDVRFRTYKKQGGVECSRRHIPSTSGDL